MKEMVSESRVHTTLSGEQNKRNGRTTPSPAIQAEPSNVEQITPNPVAAPLHMTSTEFTTAMVHFYRGEIQRSNTWRNRLDTTTNWAVLTTGATLSFVFSSPSNPAFVIPINSILVAFFMFMEARRYRYYEVWAGRVRVLETGYFAPMLSAQQTPKDQEWAEHLSADLMSPHFNISEWEAIGRRLRSNYIWIFILLALSYNLKVYIHPFPAPDMETFIRRAEVGIAPGWLVVASGIFFNALLFFLAIFTLRLKESKSEVLPLSEFSWHPLRRVSDWTRNVAVRRHEAPTTRRAKRARQRVRQSTTEIHRTEIPNKAEK
jgi:uncharacterized membrane protein